MGKTITPKYRVEIKHAGMNSTPAAWNGRATTARLEKYIEDYNESILNGGVNEHLGTRFGEGAKAISGKIIRQSDGVEVAAWPEITPAQKEAETNVLRALEALEENISDLEREDGDGEFVQTLKRFREALYAATGPDATGKVHLTVQF